MEALALVAALGEGGVIGLRGTLPWHLPEDLKHFRKVTTDHAILMGRRTWESIGRPLPRRRSIVISRRVDFEAPGAEVAPDLETALAWARQTDDEPRIIGGALLYAAALPWCTRLFLTEVGGEVEGDTFFPDFDRAEWKEVSREPGQTPGVVFTELVRQALSPPGSGR